MSLIIQEPLKIVSEIGRKLPSEWIEYRDPISNRLVRQLTNSEASNYPLYYFIPSITADGRYLIFHSERTGWVQLYRMDLQTGEMVQLTEGRTYDSGWAQWCQYRLRGIYNHLSALNLIKDEVYYFQDSEIYSTHVRTLENRCVAQLPEGQIAIGQTAFSPDGRWFAFIHTDRENYENGIRGNEVLSVMKQPTKKLRDFVKTVTLGLINTDTGEYRKVITRPHHSHHVIWIDNSTMLVNHPEGCMGMWTISVDGTGYRHLRPHTHPNAHGAQVCHQVITEKGIFYEAQGIHRGDDKPTFMGNYDVKTDQFTEVELPFTNSYVHTGLDPKGKFLFVEQVLRRGKGHEIASVHFPRDPKRYKVQILRSLRTCAQGGQRGHAHPFLTPDRKWIMHVALCEKNFSQICMVDVQDLVDLDEYF